MVTTNKKLGSDMCRRQRQMNDEMAITAWKAEDIKCPRIT